MSSSTVPHLLLHSLALTDPLVIAGGSPILLLFLCGVGLGGGGSEQPLLLLIWVFRPLAGKTIIPIHGVPPPVTPVPACMQSDLEQWAGHEW